MEVTKEKGTYSGILTKVSISRSHHRSMEISVFARIGYGIVSYEVWDLEQQSSTTVLSKSPDGLTKEALLSEIVRRYQAGMK